MEKINSRHHPNLLSIVIPAYNEEDGIDAIIQRVLAVGPDLLSPVPCNGCLFHLFFIWTTYDRITPLKHPVWNGGAENRSGALQHLSWAPHQSG